MEAVRVDSRTVEATQICSVDALAIVEVAVVRVIKAEAAIVGDAVRAVDAAVEARSIAAPAEGVTGEAA